MAHRTYELVQVDAFTRLAFAGNPCAVLPDAAGLSDEEMQQIAREMNLSETAFVFASEAADFKCRYFTPAEEVPLAGHPTIATVHALRERGAIQPDCPPPCAPGAVGGSGGGDGGAARPGRAAADHDDAAAA